MKNSVWGYPNSGNKTPMPYYANSRKWNLSKLNNRICSGKLNNVRSKKHKGWKRSSSLKKLRKNKLRPEWLNRSYKKSNSRFKSSKLILRQSQLQMLSKLCRSLSESHQVNA